jgi:hypothetical protein
MREIIRARRGALTRLALALLSLSVASCAGLAPSKMPEPPLLGEYGIDYSLEIRSSPRPLRIHVAVADMGGGRLRMATPIASPGRDPRRGEAGLEEPLREAEAISSLLLVNASAFSVRSFERGARPIAYLRGMRADIAGLAIHEGIEASPPQEGYAALGVDAEGRIAAGYGLEGAGEAAAGFSMLVEKGKATAPEGGHLAARTAIGGDAAGRLIVVVVEGGRRGASEGASLGELAGIMLDEGAEWALNMDGGGSSVMILRRGGRQERVSAGQCRFLGIELPPRPVPNFVVLLPR